jgi:hypothetical protein
MIAASAPLPDAPPVSLSPFRAWLYLIGLCCQRQARARQMVWIALGLLAFAVLFVAVNTAANRWGMHHWRYPPRRGANFVEWREALIQARPIARWPTEAERLKREASRLEVQPCYLVPWRPEAALLLDALIEGSKVALERSAFFVFSSVLFTVFLSFLLPLWSLSFATEAIGGEREGGNLVWLLSRPLSRPLIYLAKFAALLPWSLGLTLGGFGLICLAAGRPGTLAFRLYWPAIFWGTLAFSSLFLFVGAAFRRPAVVAIVYSFFLETILGNMPGYLKRASISFYTRCMMFEAGRDYDVQPEKPSVYLAVDGTTALCVLIGVTVVLIAVGMVWFAHAEYKSSNA